MAMSTPIPTMHTPIPIIIRRSITYMTTPEKPGNFPESIPIFTDMPT
jgi:hypothetical protein